MREKAMGMPMISRRKRRPEPRIPTVTGSIRMTSARAWKPNPHIEQEFQASEEGSHRHKETERILGHPEHVGDGFFFHPHDQPLPGENGEMNRLRSVWTIFSTICPRSGRRATKSETPTYPFTCCV